MRLLCVVLITSSLVARGSGLWRPDTQSLRVTRSSGFVQGSVGSQFVCVALSRSELSPSQLRYLETLQLEPGDGTCVADGWNDVTLTFIGPGREERAFSTDSCMRPDAGVIPREVWDVLGAPGGRPCP
jgi:hypothetical protein